MPMVEQGGNTEYKQQYYSAEKTKKSAKKDIKQAEKSIEAAEKAYKAARTKTDKELAQKKLDTEKANLEKAKKDAINAENELNNLKIKHQDELNAKNKEAIKKAFDDAGQSIANGITNGLGELKSTLDETMNDFIEKQESMAYGLTGTATDLKSVTQTFTQALGSTGVVQQQKVYNNLANLIQSGIIFNAEQRAYLATIANDLGMVFDPTEGALTRLINLQRQDLSDERMAIEYSLKQFLNQNYQTSQYIKEGFADVSSSLVEAQSLMNANSAMQFEAAVQQWLGSMSSVGASSIAINSLATAIGQLGSGDLSVLSSAQFPLLAMAAANAGLDLGTILNDGLTSTTADALLKGVAQYASSLYSSSSSNLVLSELGKAFGISNVSDLVAISQVGNVSAGGTLSTDISNLLGNMDNYLYTTTKINNSLANFMYNWALDTASSDTNYLIYKITDVISQATAAMFNGVNIEAGILGNGVQLNLSQLISATPLLATIPGLINSIGGLGKLLTGSGSAQAIYDALSGGSLAGNNQKLSVNGLFSGLTGISGTNTSGALAYFNTNTSDIGNTAKISGLLSSAQMYSQEEQQKTLDDVYDLLEGFKTTSFGTYSKIVESDNKVTIGNDLSFVQDMIAFSAFNIQNIYALLVEYLKPTNVSEQRTYDLDQVQWSSPFDWYSSANMG